MGCTPSNLSRAQTHRVHGAADSRMLYDIEDNDNLEVYAVDIYDQRAIAQLKRDFRENLDIFLLNNILMSVMFFENYDVEMKKAKSTISIEDQEMSRKLITDHNKRCIMPDTAAELVNHRVRYSRRHGKLKNIEESLVTQRMYVVYDTIEILKEHEDLDHYSGIDDKPTDRAHVQNSKHHGFVKLRHPAYQTSPNGSSVSSSSTSASMNGRDVLTPPFDEPSTSRESLCSQDDAEYTQINEMKTLQPLSQTRSSSNSSGGPLPCLRPIKSKNLEHVDETDDLYIIHNYYDSTEFMKHFRSQVFPGELADSLGFDENAMMEATHNARAIYCSSEHERGGPVKFEIVPAVVNPWPGLNAWAVRDRPTVMDRRSMIAYRWPTPQMIQEVVNFSAALVPRGFTPKKRQNPDYNLEWEVNFPKAEKYMHMRMSHAQMRCYLFMAILHKTFIEPLTQEKGVLFDHMRTLIYWECEKNYKDWPENRLGEKLLMLLKILQANLGKQDLRDYFVESKNVLENIPGNYLWLAQKTIHNICERPIGHFLSALRNITYSARRFYPMPDFDELYKILVVDDSMTMLNPIVFNVSANEANIQNAKTFNSEQKWLQTKMAKTRKIREQIESDLNIIENEPRHSVDSIDVKWTANGYTRIDPSRALMFLRFFIEHFIKIAEKSMKYHGATSQALLYLKQSWYLTKVMEDSNIGGEVFARELQTKIQELETLCKESATEDAYTPNTPARNSVNQIQHQVVKSVTVDLNNVSQQFLKGYQSSSNVQPNDIKRRNTKVRINSMVERL